MKKSLSSNIIKLVRRQQCPVFYLKHVSEFFEHCAERPHLVFYIFLKVYKLTSLSIKYRKTGSEHQGEYTTTAKFSPLATESYSLFNRFGCIVRCAL